VEEAGGAGVTGTRISLAVADLAAESSKDGGSRRGRGDRTGER